MEDLAMYEPVISVLVETETKTHQEALEVALRKLAEEDPTFRWETDSGTGSTTISGMGELHLEIILDRIRHEFQVKVENDPPQVIYRKEPGVVLEPIMLLEVTTPGEFRSKVASDIYTRRGQIHQFITQEDTTFVLKAEVPLAEILGYADSLRALTRGRASYTMRFDRYEVVPANPVPPDR